MVKCPYCGSERGFRSLKEWRLRFYHVTLFQCENCNGKFNYYHGVSPKGKRSEFIIRVKPRVR
jgi:transposase-like protein